jgi:hypothetical protein
MTYKWQEKQHSPRRLRRSWGVRLLTTEAQTMDEALDILERRRRSGKRIAAFREGQRTHKQPSLKLLLSISKARAALAVKKRCAEARPVRPDPFAFSTLAERDAMVRHLYGSGYWSAGAIGRKFRLSVTAVLDIVRQGEVP